MVVLYSSVSICHLFIVTCCVNLAVVSVLTVLLRATILCRLRIATTCISILVAVRVLFSVAR